MEDYPEIDWNAIYEAERKYAIKQMFVKVNMTNELKDDFRFVVRWFYWLKALICLKLKRTKYIGYPIWPIHVIYFGEYYHPEESSWQEVTVAPGLFKGWYASVGSDGT